MQLSKIDTWTIELKTREVTASIGETISVGNVRIDGPGEYDVASVAVEGLLTPIQTIFVIEAEGIRICVVPKATEQLTPEMIQTIGNVHIAVVPIAADSSIALTTALVNSLEPNIVIPIGDGNLAEFAKLSGASSEEQPVLKVTPGTFINEERSTVLLHSIRSMKKG